MFNMQAWSNKEVKHLQGMNERLLKRIVELKGTVMTLNSKIDPLTLDDSLNQFVEQCLGSEDVIYLVGGFDGFSSLPSLDSFSPSLDILTPLKPMAVGKSYSSTVALEGKIFVLGGGDGACWFDTGYYLASKFIFLLNYLLYCNHCPDSACIFWMKLTVMTEAVMIGPHAHR